MKCLSSFFEIFKITCFLLLIFFPGGSFFSHPPAQAQTPTPTPVSSRISSENVGIGTYFSGYARWAHSIAMPETNIVNNLNSQSDVFHQVRAKWAREDFPWFEIEKTPGNFDWSLTGGATDLAISLYTQNDNITIILQKTPPWASSAPRGTTDPNAHKYPDSDPDLNRWKNYLTQVVNRYKNKVKYWEIWNEADITQDPGITLLPKPGETREQSYYKILKAAYISIKTADPSAQILTNAFGSWNISGNLNSPLIGDLMISYIMSQPHEPSDGWPYFDIFNIHIYGANDPAAEIQKAKNLLENWPQTSSKSIWVTETNVNDYLTSPPQPGMPTPPPGGNTVDNASRVMDWWLNRQINEGTSKVFWFTLLNWECDPGCPDFKTAGLAKISDFSKQSTWSVMNKSLCPSGDLGNLNCDVYGLINETDLTFMLEKWALNGPAPPVPTSYHSPDLNNDNKVNAEDLNILIQYWSSY